MKTFLAFLSLLSSVVIASPGDWEVNEKLHERLKSGNGRPTKELVSLEASLAQEGFKGQNSPEDGKLRIMIERLGSKSRFYGNISYVGIRNGWICTASILIEGSTSSKPIPALSDYKMETVKRQDGGCGPE